MQGNDDKTGMNHQLNTLLKPGIANTNQCVREYLLTADNELDGIALYSMNSTGAKTMSALPSNTVMILAYINSESTNNIVNIIFKRNTADTMTFAVEGGFYSATTGNSHLSSMVWLPTYGNTIYINTITGTISVFKIFGYKVKEG